MITVVTDSTVYMTKQQAEQLGVRVIPMTYIVEGQRYLESYSECNGDFEKLLSGSKAQSTMQIPVAAFISVFEELIRQGMQVLCITISSRLSGAYRSASVAATRVCRRIGRDDVMVVDSLTTGGGLYLLVQAAVEALASVKEPPNLKDLVQKMEETRLRIGVAFSVDNMEALRSSGRIGIVRQSVGTILNIRPILVCQDGAVVSRGTARGKSEQIRGLLRQIPLQSCRFVINAVSASTDTSRLEQELKTIFPNYPVRKNLAGPVLGIHLGLGAVAVSWMVKDTIEDR